ncbi:MAG TPA: pilus assembly protein TadG-related protein, partial [Candidatus Dormibacteraeota bacterium]|nr:pilus assembly protein TadG-related protein [Candidatus Dormibacteraeota bacterium]
MRKRQAQSGQVLVIVAVWLVALIGSAALILLTGSVEWQRNQLQQIADQAALDAAMKIVVGCTAGSAATVITEADNFVSTQRTRSGSLAIGAGACASGYTGTDSFSSGITETIVYPYRAHQQQVEVTLTEALPISFGNYLGATNTNVTRRAVAQQLNGSTVAVTATTLSCTGGQFNVSGSVVTSNAVSLSGSCAVYAHDRFDATSSTYSDLGDANVYASGQAWVGAGGHCAAGANTGSANAICTDGFEVSGHTAVTCGTAAVSAYLAAGDATINPNPCAAGTGAQPVPPVGSTLPPEPNSDPTITATLPGGAPCSSAGSYANVVVNGVTVGTGNAAAPTQDAGGYVHFKTGCYGYLDVGNLGSTGTITNRQIGVEGARQRHFVIATLPAPSIAGTLLVATLTSEESPNKSTPPSGSWLQANQADQIGAGRTEIWYFPNNPGNLQSFQFALNPATDFGELQITEWSGAAAAPLDQTGSTTVAVPSPTSVNATSGATTATNELVITDEGFTIAAGQTFTPSATYTS